jgi:alpha,alpha-trehalase
LTMSTTDTGLQWDYPYGWAPCTWIAIEGLRQTGEGPRAIAVARAFESTIERNYASDSTIREKYNVVTGTTDVSVHNGYTSNVAGFGWTNGVYVDLRTWLSHGHASGP